MTAPSSINIPLLRKVMEHITAHPEQYDQREYAVRTDCGTTHCIAGWALAFSGHEFQYRGLGVSDYRTADDFGWRAQLGTTADGFTEGSAADALGLQWADSLELFHYRNTLEQVWAIVERLTEGEITRQSVLS